MCHFKLNDLTDWVSQQPQLLQKSETGHYPLQGEEKQQEFTELLPSLFWKIFSPAVQGKVSLFKKCDSYGQKVQSALQHIQR